MSQQRYLSVPSPKRPVTNQIRGSERKSLTGAWLVLVIPLFIGGFFYGWAHMPFFFLKVGVPNPLTIILGLITLAMLGRVAWETVRLKRFGDPVLDLTDAPIPLGGTVEGRIVLSSDLRDSPSFSVKLQCIRRVLQQGSKNSHWVETALWTKEETVSLLPGGTIPVSVAVSPDQQETNSSDAFDQILWRLTVRGAFRGPSFLERYEIPVAGRTSAAEAIVKERGQASELLQPPQKLFTATLPFLIIGLAILAGGTYLLLLGIADIKEASASAAWPSVQGLVRQAIPPKESAIFVSRNEFTLAYTFQVNDTRYTSHAIYPHLLWQRSSVLQMLKAYSPGSAVTVYYSPTDPAKSCLLSGLRAGVFQRLIMALLVLTLGILFAASALLAPRDAVMTGGSITFRKGSLGSKTMGYSFWALIVFGLLLWRVT